jgi:hypothetical protein
MCETKNGFVRKDIVPNDPVLMICRFIEVVKDDARINAYHISLYAALILHWSQRGFENPMQVFSREVMPFCKISGTATYHRSIRDLCDFGYIKYVPSFNHFLGSLVYLVAL